MYRRFVTLPARRHTVGEAYENRGLPPSMGPKKSDLVKALQGAEQCFRMRLPAFTLALLLTDEQTSLNVTMLCLVLLTSWQSL